MSWGNPFAKAWNAATQTAKQAASAVATGANWVGKQSKAAFDYSAAAAKKTSDAIQRTAIEVKNKAVDAYESAKDKAVETYESAKKKAVDAYDAGKHKAIETYESVKKKAVDAYASAKDKVVDAYEWAKAMTAKAIDAARGSVRDGLRSLADTGFDAMAAVHDSIEAIKQRAQAAYDKVREWFPAKLPELSLIDCCPNPSEDGAADGHFMAPGDDGTCSTLAKDATAAKARNRAALSESACCRQRRAAGEPTRDIVYVNGINTTRKDHCHTLHAIAEQTCGNVIGIYNATEGGAADAVQTGQDRRLIKAANEGKTIPSKDGRNPAVDRLSDYVVDEVAQGRPPDIFAHSQGGAVTSLALYDARATLPWGPDPLTKVKVTSMGSAAPVWPNGPTYEHYVHVNDATPSAFGLGHQGSEDGARAGQGATVVRFSGDPKSVEPFNDRNPKLDWFPETTANHGVEDAYLRMVRQRNGGCP